MIKSAAHSPTRTRVHIRFVGLGFKVHGLHLIRIWGSFGVLALLRWNWAVGLAEAAAYVDGGAADCQSEDMGSR